MGRSNYELSPFLRLERVFEEFFGTIKCFSIGFAVRLCSLFSLVLKEKVSKNIRSFLVSCGYAKLSRLLGISQFALKRPLARVLFQYGLPIVC